jgi:hypothetical protein
MAKTMASLARSMELPLEELEMSAWIVGLWKIITTGATFSSNALYSIWLCAGLGWKASSEDAIDEYPNRKWLPFGESSSGVLDWPWSS